LAMRAGQAKQSRYNEQQELDCFVASAPGI
jgi:hypothetical protein